MTHFNEYLELNLFLINKDVKENNRKVLMRYRRELRRCILLSASDIE